MNAVTYALLAVIAVEAGDHIQAECHLRAAQRYSRANARRERQLVEIAALIVRGDLDRACGLSFEHAAEFPDDADLLTSIFNPPPNPHHHEDSR